MLVKLLTQFAAHPTGRDREFMEIGIIGLPGCGKTTIFNAVTKGTVSVAGYSDKPNVGVAKVPDERLDTLANMYNPRT